MMPPVEEQRLVWGKPVPVFLTVLLFTALLAGVAPVKSQEHSAGTQELEQEKILIKGNQGLPTILFIAPWKKVRGKVPEGQSLERSLDQSVEAVDQEVFQRKLEFYEKGHAIE